MTQIVRLILLLVFAGVCVRLGDPRSGAGDAVLSISGDIAGEIDICNCSGDMYGGFPRRVSQLDQLRAEGRPVLAVDLGNAFASSSAQGRLKAEYMYRLYARMGYDALNVAENDLLFGPAYITEIAQANHLNLISATMAKPGGGGLLFAPYVVRSVEVNGKTVRIGILGVTGHPNLKTARKILDSQGVELIPVKDALARVIPELRAKSDLIVIVGQLNGDEIDALAKEYPDIAAIISGRGNREAGSIESIRSAPLPGSSIDALHKPEKPVVYFGKSEVKKLTIRADIALDDAGKVSSVAISEHLIDPKIPRSPDAEAMLKEYYAKLATIPPPPPIAASDLPATQRIGYVGSDKCGECHKAQYEMWKLSDHAKAITTLANTGQTKDHDCLPCHTTGYLKPSGFRDVDLTPGMVNVQCEDCHSAGSGHVESPNRGYGRKAILTCRNCHTPERDTDWNLARCREKIRH